MARRIVLGRMPQLQLSERSSIVNHLDLHQISRFDRSYPRFQTLNLTGCEIDTFEYTDMELEQFEGAVLANGNASRAVHLRYTQGLLPELGPYDIRSDGREENSLEMFNDVMSNYIKRISELTQMFHRFGTSTPAEQSKRVELVFSTADLVEACAEPTVKLLCGFTQEIVYGYQRVQLIKQMNQSRKEARDALREQRKLEHRMKNLQLRQSDE